jgi:hypothetical protein
MVWYSPYKLLVQALQQALPSRVEIMWVLQHQRDQRKIAVQLLHLHNPANFSIRISSQLKYSNRVASHLLCSSNSLLSNRQSLLLALHVPVLRQPCCAEPGQAINASAHWH